ncbi:protein ecdysoneless homolog [Gouania willdenowi]|uniref:Ecdysoneless homolog (Drosophila) n=1 Tax=Gouania willdenowi TaxID=441366 RepID=A0A8C5D9D1_GOUWI|nr:protein ecdysoneless homolog [Gouania willdenowi]XP_028323842.1 protein ecdysoneless homolog [Gouania willdenowi]XP_028323843.1 protein ecdysoneless homolog [Gouania willdenowi]
MDVLQRKVIQEDVVQYRLFLVQTDGLSPQQIEQRLTHLVDDILANVAPLLIDYIWQHQPFGLKYHPKKGDVPAHIGGSTQFGDSIEDEWFIVYLLQQITEAFPELAACAEDNDGEFLLIEAADYLPKWLNPDTSENRVFIYHGKLHIIPSPSKASSVGFSKDIVPSVAQALALLLTHAEACEASGKMNAAVRKRLHGYPEKIKAGLHRAHCFVPAGVAAVLSRRPKLVAQAVSAFYLRDPIDLQACRVFKTFPPDKRVLTMVTFTRCLYAQLQQQQFTPERRSGFTLPPRSHPQYKAHELGMKLAHGFEILCSRCRLPSSDPDAAISCNPQWKRFMESLIRNGYFQGELEGSARHRKLKKSAENFFKTSVASKSSDLSPGEEVLQLLQTESPLDMEELEKLESQLPQEDSDSWLDITAQDLEQLLTERSGGRADIGSQKPASTEPMVPHAGGAEDTGKVSEDKAEEEEAGYSLVAVTQGMKNFLNAMSSHEGAEIPWRSSNQPLNIDPDLVSKAMDRLLGNTVDELDSDDFDEDEDEEDDEVEEDEEGAHGQVESNGTDSLGSIKEIMEQMDQELLSTNIGQSFGQTNKADPHSGPSSSNPPPAAADSFPTDEEIDDLDSIQPLDLDVNLVANLLESLSCEAGLAGPASNLLQSLGIHLPPNSDTT